MYWNPPDQPAGAPAATTETPQESQQKLDFKGVWKSSKIAEFIKNNQIELADLQTKITLDETISITEKSSPAGAGGILKLLQDAKALVGVEYNAYDLSKLWIAANDSEVNSLLEILAKPPVLMPEDKRKVLKNAALTVIALKSKARKYLEITQSTSASLDEQKSDFDLQGQVGDMGKYLGETVPQNWDKLSTQEKVGFAAATLIGGALVMNAPPGSMMEKVGGMMKKVLYGVGGAVFINYLSKIFTGKSGLDWLSQGVNGAVDKATDAAGYFKTTIFEAAFGTDKGQGEKVQKTIIALGQIPFSELAAQYEAGQVNSENLPPAEAKEGLDYFFGRYPLSTIKPLFEGRTPPPTFSQVVIEMMVEDEKLDFGANFAGQLAPAAAEVAKKDPFSGGVREWFFAPTMTGVLLAEKYKEKFGKDITPDELAKMSKLFKCEIKDESSLKTAVDNALAPKDEAKRKEYHKNLESGVLNAESQARLHKGEDGYFYISFDIDLENNFTDSKESTKAIEDRKSDVLRALIDRSDLLTQTGQSQMDILYQFVENSQQVFIQDQVKSKYFTRIAVKQAS